MKITDRIINSEMILNHFGYWPTFHDSIISRVIFNTLPTYRYSIKFFVSAFEITNQINQEGYYVLDKKCLLEIEFSGIYDLEFEGFGFQNVAYEILFTVDNEYVTCEINPSVGLYAKIKAEEVVVIHLQKTDD